MSERLRILYVVDDGWRYEKQRAVRALKAAGHEVIAASHVEQSAEALREAFGEALYLPSVPVPGWRYYPAMFFAKEIGTVVVRNRNLERMAEISTVRKALYRLREVCGALGLHRRRFHEVRRRLYRGSEEYMGVLGEVDRVVFSPVAVADQRLLHEAKAMGVPVLGWIFSWDNPVKDNDFFLDADSYGVWNEETVEDMERVQGIPPEKARVIGPAHYDEVLARAGGGSRSEGEEREEAHVLYVCATGRDFLVSQEVELVLWIREQLDAVAPEVGLRVRPYPFRMLHADYAELEEREGIEVQHFGRESGGVILVEEAEEERKLRQIEAAACMINFGSTMGLEASLTDTPILQFTRIPPVRVRGPHALADCLGNEHLRHMIEGDFPNLIDGEERLRGAFRDLLVEGNSEAYRRYSEKLRGFIDPMPERRPYMGLFVEWVEKGGGLRSRKTN